MIQKIIAISVIVLGVYPATNHHQQRKVPSVAGSAVHPATHLLTVKRQNPDALSLSEYRLVFQDDFNGQQLNTHNWDYLEENTVRGYGKMLRSNVQVSGGTLQLLAKKEFGSDGQPQFSASMISTQHSLNQKYGYFEIRAKVNKQLGPHSAFWLLQHSVGKVNATANPSIYGTEIDIFEYHRAAGVENLYFGLHWNGYNFNDGSHGFVYGTSHIPGIAEGFHTFALEWTPREYKVFVDGVQRARSDTAVSHIPEFIVLSTEINGYGGDRLQMSSSQPDVFEVDYIKVYARRPEVTIYGACDGYGWVSKPLLPGKYTKTQLAAHGVLPKQASAFEIPDGWTLEAYDKDNFSGKMVRYTKNIPCAGSFNNKLSSLIIKGK